MKEYWEKGGGVFFFFFFLFLSKKKKKKIWDDLRVCVCYVKNMEEKGDSGLI